VAATDTLMEALGKLEAQIIANDAAFENTGHWLKNGSSIYFDTGNVGVGTASPTRKLHVSGDAAKFERDGMDSGLILDVNNADGTDLREWHLLSGITDGKFFIRDAGIDGTADSRRLVIDINGNVGVGTEAPLDPLHVSRDKGLTAGEHWILRAGHPTLGGVVLGYEADGTNYVASKVRSSSNTPLVLGTTNNKTALTINDNGSANYRGNPITSYNPRMSIQLGNNDWTDMTVLDSGSYAYSAADFGIKTTGPSWFRIKVRMPVDPQGVYRATVRVKKIDGDGTFYVGASSLDDSFNDIKTDGSNSYNYFAAASYTVAAGATYTASGTISGYNATTDTNRNKFDPYAKYFDLVIITNYQGTGSSVIEAVEVYKEPTPEPWRSVAFENAWVNYGSDYSPVGYYKDTNGVVHLRGLTKSGTIGTCIFTLPEGYRPNYRRLLTAQTYPNASNRVDIHTNGCVNATSGDPAWIALDELSFRVTP
jgi:hypothetical protein